MPIFQQATYNTSSHSSFSFTLLGVDFRVDKDADDLGVFLLLSRVKNFHRQVVPDFSVMGTSKNEFTPSVSVSTGKYFPTDTPKRLSMVDEYLDTLKATLRKSVLLRLDENFIPHGTPCSSPNFHQDVRSLPFEKRKKMKGSKQL